MEEVVKILVVDDNIEFIQGLELLLKKDPCKLYAATDGRQGLELVRSVKPDIILLDVVMPVMDGFDVLKQLRSEPEFSNTIVVMLSGVQICTDDQAAGLEAGADGYIARPLSNRELLARIRGYIRLVHAEKARDEHAAGMEQYNLELKRSNLAKDKLFSIIAHDLRNPFNAFLDLLDMLDEEYHTFDESERLRIIRTVRSSSHNLAGLLENLLAWSRLQQDQIVLQPVKIMLGEIVENCLETHRLQIEAKQIRLSKSIPEATELVADPDMLKTILRNLISNAVKFTPEKGNIEIAAVVKHENEVEVSVADSGTGMSPEAARELFTDHPEAHRDGTGGEKGSGLGLVLCKEFVEKHGGKIRVESGEGKGSRFFFTMPYSNENEKNR